MLERMRFLPWLMVAAAALLVSCATPPGAAQRPKNVIVLYADGVAITQLEFGRYSSRALRNAGYAVTDTVLGQGSIGFLTTHPHEAFATDSAATASAMSTGVKTTIVQPRGLSNRMPSLRVLWDKTRFGGMTGDEALVDDVHGRWRVHRVLQGRAAPLRR